MPDVDTRIRDAAHALLKVLNEWGADYVDCGKFQDHGPVCDRIVDIITRERADAEAGALRWAGGRVRMYATRDRETLAREFEARAAAAARKP